MLWALKELSQEDCSLFGHPNPMLKLMGKKIFTLRLKNFVCLDLYNDVDDNCHRGFHIHITENIL